MRIYAVNNTFEDSVSSCPSTAVLKLIHYARTHSDVPSHKDDGFQAENVGKIEASSSGEKIGSRLSRGCKQNDGFDAFKQTSIRDGRVDSQYQPRTDSD